MDVCPDLPLFADSRTDAPGARRTTEALQLPVHAGLSGTDLERVAGRARRALSAAGAGGSEVRVS